MSPVPLAYQSVFNLPIQIIHVKIPLPSDIADLTDALSSTLVQKQEPPVIQHQQSHTNILLLMSKIKLAILHFLLIFILPSSFLLMLPSSSQAPTLTNFRLCFYISVSLFHKSNQLTVSIILSPEHILHSSHLLYFFHHFLIHILVLSPLVYYIALLTHFPGFSYSLLKTVFHKTTR